MDKEYLDDIYQILYFKELYKKSHKNLDNKEKNSIIKEKTGDNKNGNLHKHPEKYG